MKKIFLLIYGICGMALCVLAQQSATVKGVAVNGWQDGTVLQISELTGDKGISAQATVENGQFEFSVPLQEPLFLYVTSQDGRVMFNLMLSPGEQVTMKFIDGKIEFEGAALQKEMEKQIMEPFNNQNKRRNELWKEYKDVIIAANQPEEGGKVKNSAEYKDYMMKKDKLELAFEEEMEVWVRQHASTIWAPIAMFYNPSCKPSRELYNAFSPEIKDSFYGKQVYQKVKDLLTGKQAPDFTLKDAAGKEHSLEELLEGHQYLLVDFWASWCAPCRKGIPEMKEFAKKYADKGLVVLSISVDKDRDAWLKALEEEQMPWTNLWDDAGIKVKYGVKGIPSVFLIQAADGTVLFEQLYGEAIRQQLKKILGE